MWLGGRSFFENLSASNELEIIDAQFLNWAADNFQFQGQLPNVAF